MSSFLHSGIFSSCPGQVFILKSLYLLEKGNMPTTPTSSENTSLVTLIPYRKLSYTTVIGKNVLNQSLRKVNLRHCFFMYYSDYINSEEKI